MTATTKAQLPGVWRLFRLSLGDLRRHWKLLGGIVALVAIPANALTLVSSVSSDSGLSTYLSIATIIMNLALIWTVLALGANRQPTLRQAYYQGTGRLIPFALVSTVLILGIVPLALGLVVFGLGVAAAGTATSAPERLLLAVAALILALPTLFLVTRWLFSIFIVQNPEQRPLAALGASWNLVRGRSWSVFGRLVGLVGVVALILIVPVIALVLLYGSTANRLFLALLQLIITLVSLPLGNLYLGRLYRELR